MHFHQSCIKIARDLSYQGWGSPTNKFEISIRKFARIPGRRGRFNGVAASGRNLPLNFFQIIVYHKY